MTIREILALPTDQLEALSDKDLDNLLGPLIPAARNPDKEAAKDRDINQLLKRAQAVLGGT